MEILKKIQTSYTMLQSPEILIRITQSIVTAFSDSVSFESVKNKWIEIKKTTDLSIALLRV